MTTIKFPTDFVTKSSPVNADLLMIADSADSNKLKKITYSNLKGAQGDPGVSIVWKWAYSWGTAYIINDAVSYNGSAYICKLASTGNLPTNTTYWDVMLTFNPATETSIWGGELATTAQFNAGTDTEGSNPLFVKPSQIQWLFVSTSSWSADEWKSPRLNSSWKIPTWFLPTYPTAKRDSIMFNYDTSTASWTQVINHSLWVNPQSIDFQAIRNEDFTFWSWDWTDNVCIYGANNSGTTWDSSTYCMRSQISWADYATAVISSVSSTTFTITWTKTWAAAWTLRVVAKVMAVS